MRLLGFVLIGFGVGGVAQMVISGHTEPDKIVAGFLLGLVLGGAAILVIGKHHRP